MRWMLVLAVVLLTIGAAEAQTSLPVPQPTCAPAAEAELEDCTTSVDISADPAATYSVGGMAEDAQGNKVIWPAVDSPGCSELLLKREGKALVLAWTCRKGMTYTFTVAPK